MRKLLLLRPEPGLTASADRARAMGLEVRLCPLFQVEPVEWQAPDPAQFDALLMTSANVVHHGGPQLSGLLNLPVQAVGPATSAAAEAAGFQVEQVGAGDVVELLDALPCSVRLLHLAGEDHRHVADARIDRRIVYRSSPIPNPPLPPLAGMVVAVHSPRAGERLAQLAGDRRSAAVAAISVAAAEACGGGWERVEAADQPNDKCLLALAAQLCHTPSPQ